MENKKKCPACGALLQETLNVCPACGLEGVNLRFLSRAGYEKWVQEVLVPHKAALAPRVFAGYGFGLILTAKGDLYGVGNNYDGQISEEGPDKYALPHLMATDVISAAAGQDYTIYVTKDGEVHLRGRGEIADRFTGFSGAKEVYVNSWYCESFWILDRMDRVWCFGRNYDEELQPRKKTFQCLLPEEIATTSYRYHTEEENSQYRSVLTGSIVWWEKDGLRDSWNWTAEDKFRKSQEYRELANQYGSINVEIELNTEFLNCGKKEPGYQSSDRHRYRPKLYVTNEVLYCPILNPEYNWMAETPHRCGSKPVREIDFDSVALPFNSSKKIVCNRKYSPYFFRCFSLEEDGSVLWIEGKEKQTPPEWMQVPMADLGLSCDFMIFACKNGDILWKTGDDPGKGDIQRCRLLTEKEMSFAKVFAGEDHDLLLTKQGFLYGIGSNRSGQIEEQGEDHYDQLRLMETDVISAAAGGSYTIYVTRDGEVHLRGRGEIADRFAGFSNVEEVCADHEDSFWLRTRQGEIFGFGCNKFEPKRSHIWKTLEPESYVAHSWVVYRWSTCPAPFEYWHKNNYNESYAEFKMNLQKDKNYLRAIQIFGGENAYMDLGDYDMEEVPGDESFDWKREREGYDGIKDISADRYTYIPKIVITNEVIYKPILCTDVQWIHDMPYQEGSSPAAAPDPSQQGIIQKLMGNGGLWLNL